MSGSQTNVHQPDDASARSQVGAAPAQSDPPLLRHDVADGPDSAAAPGFLVGGLTFDPRRPVIDPIRLELAKTCAAKFDDALSPLVAACMVHPALARILCTGLRVELMENVGPEMRALVFERVEKAIAVVTESAEQMGGA